MANFNVTLSGFVLVLVLAFFLFVIFWLWLDPWILFYFYIPHTLRETSGNLFLWAYCDPIRREFLLRYVVLFGTMFVFCPACLYLQPIWILDKGVVYHFSEGPPKTFLRIPCGTYLGNFLMQMDTCFVVFLVHPMQKETMGISDILFAVHILTLFSLPWSLLGHVLWTT